MRNIHIRKAFIFGALFGALTCIPTARAQKVTHDDYQRLQVEFTTGNLKVGEILLNGKTYNTLSIEGYIASTEVGQPCLPTYSTLIEAPLCDGYEVSVSNAVYDTLDAEGLGLSHLLAPLQPSRSKSDTLRHPTLIGNAYGANTFYRVATASVEPVGIARDRNLARLQFSPVSYNPVSGQVIICRHATVDVRYIGADREATLNHYNLYHSPAFGSGINVLNSLYPKAVRTTAPVRYLIVAHSMFRGYLDNFVQWKRRKGFMVDVAYTDSAAVGTNCTSIQSFIKNQYSGATTSNPAPTYLLLVGDHEQLPAFTGTTDNDHITDLYYTTWTTGDNIPDCYHGRFSAQTVDQLMPQIQKTLMYEQYTFNDPSFLDRAVMVAGVDGGSAGDHGYTHADPTMDYAIFHYINGEHGFSQVSYFKNDTSVVPAGSNVTVAGNSNSMSATVRNRYNQGAGWINYSAHGSATSWGTPNFTTTHASSMTNSQKFGLMIGNCCLTNKFETSTCLGEAVLRKGNYCGAVGYIGGSNSTYWNEDFYWSVGLRNNISATMSLAYNSANLGAYDRLCHTHGETYSQWVTTQGALMFQGNMAVESSSSSRKLYYWEIYHLMGDPSLMPYLTQADEIEVSVMPIIIPGYNTLTVTAVPYAYVALTDTVAHDLVTSAYADAAGQAVLMLPSTLAVGGYELAVSAQQYRTTFRNITVIQPEGSFAYVCNMAPANALQAGTLVPLSITLSNPGDSITRDIVLHLTTNNPSLTLTTDSIVIDSLNAGVNIIINHIAYANVSNGATDGDNATISASVSWNGCQEPIATTFPFTLQAPVLTLSVTGDVNLLPATNGTVNVTLANIGHADAHASHLHLVSPTLLLSVSETDTQIVSLPVGATATHSFTLTVDSTMPQNIIIPMQLNLAEAPYSLDTTVGILIGTSFVETFNAGTFHVSGWSQGSYPWTFDSSNGSLRSTSALTHSQTAEISITHAYPVADSISFRYKVSSENNYDKFHFYIDGTDMLTASGDVDWTRAAFAVSAGNHTFKFSYAKDYSVSSGSDCAWIDDVTFPTPVQPVVLRRDTVCQDAEYVLFGDTIDTGTPGVGVGHGTVDGTLTIVDYIVLDPISVTDSVIACDSYLWYDTEYTTDGTYSQTVHTAGCDIFATLMLTLHHSVADTIVETVNADSYQWNNLEYTISGVYQQVFSTADGCDSIVTLELTLLGTEGISPLPISTLTLHPNPTTGSVILSERADEVLVYDAQGRLVVRQRDVQQLDLSQLPQGIYTVRVSTSQGTAALRLIRQ